MTFVFWLVSLLYLGRNNKASCPKSADNKYLVDLLWIKNYSSLIWCSIFENSKSFFDGDDNLGSFVFQFNLNVWRNYAFTGILGGNPQQECYNVSIVFI